MLLIYNEKTNPFFNLAMEEYFLKNFDEDIFILWRNESSVIVGKNQNTLSEINLNYIKENSIPVVRRQSGGGAVFHDLGNINFTFIANNNDNFSDFKRFTTPIIELLKTLDINAKFSGRNDLLIDGCKFSGNAQYNYKNKVMHHGTLLFSSQISDISNALKVKPIKFEGKSIKSVKARVTNISEHLKVPMDILEFKDLIIDYFKNNKNVIVDKSTWDWNFGHSPKYSLYNELKYPGGNVEFNLNVEGGIIKDIKFFGDFFGKCDISHIENLLLNTKHEEESLKTILNSININDYFLGADTDVLVSGIMGVK